MNIELGFFDWPGKGAEFVVGRYCGSYFVATKKTYGEARVWNNRQKLRIQGKPLSSSSGEQRHPSLWCPVDETLIFLMKALGDGVANYVEKVWWAYSSFPLMLVYLQNFEQNLEQICWSFKSSRNLDGFMSTNNRRLEQTICIGQKTLGFCHFVNYPTAKMLSINSVLRSRVLY